MKPKMSKGRLDGMYLLLMGSLVFLLLGGVLENNAPAPMSDFKAIYYGARSIIHHSDPYQNGAILREFLADGGEFPSDPIISQSVQRAVLVCINLPTSLFLVAPFACLPFGLSHLLWMALMAVCLLLASYLMWDLGAAFSPVLTGALIGLVLANSEVLVIIGNAAAIVIGLGLIAIWCFVKDRFAAVGVFCLAISLALKPHDLGFIWLYLLLAGGTLRKRAIQTLVLAVAISIPAVLWISHVSPHWVPELLSNLVETSAPGDLNDPGPSSMGAHTLGMVISLQTVISEFRDDPSFYKPVTYLVIGPLILLWIVVTMRSRFTVDRMWLALACISALSLLPVYHRSYDAKVLLLSIPACAMLWSRGGMIRWLALAFNTLAIVFTSDLAWIFFSFVVGRLRPHALWITDAVLNAMIVFPAPIALLATGILYLWLYIREAAIKPSQNIATNS
jgi:hypothetical protein